MHYNLSYYNNNISVLSAPLKGGSLAEWWGVGFEI